MDIWGRARCTFNETTGELIINADGGSVVIDASSNNKNYVVPWRTNDFNKNNVKLVDIKNNIAFIEGSVLSELFSDFYNCESFSGLENLNMDGGC